MRTRNVYLLLLVVLSTVPLLHAEIPLELIGEAVIPPGASWDLQWVDEDYTLAWVSASELTVQWAELPDGAVQQMTVAVDLDTLNNGSDFIQWSGWPTVAWMRWPGAPNDRCVLWQRVVQQGFDSECWYTERHVLLVLNLSAGQIIGHCFTTGGYEFCTGPNSSRKSSQMSPLQATPPLPNITQFMAFTNHCLSVYLGMGDYSERHDYSDFYALTPNEAISCSLQSPRFEADTLLFLADSVLTMAFGGRRHDDYYSSYGGHNSYHYSWIGLHCLAGATTRDSLHGSLAVPQQGDGTVRLILPGAAALNATTFDTLWANPEIGGQYFTARYPGSTEQVFVHRSTANRFFVHWPSDGSLVDSTSTYAGRFNRILKGTTDGHAILTFDAESRTARVYQLIPRSLNGITCSYEPENEQIVLHWSPMPGAAAYRVWMSFDAAEWGEQIAQVSETEYSVTLVDEPELRFFHVTVEY